MALIPCTECGRQISDQATACPSCGAPPATSMSSVKSQRRGIVTTQQTSKVFKAGQLVGVLLLIAGVVSCSTDKGGADMAGTVGFFLLGLVIYAGSRLGAWWRNG